MNVSKQNYISKTDKYVYNENNQIKENNLIINSNETNINEQNEENNNDTEFELEAKSIDSVISHHIKISLSDYDEKLIDNIYNLYLNNFTYEENNSTLRMLNSLKKSLSSNDLEKYEIIEENNIRNLKEYEMESFMA
jgi:hypothetical protein